MSESKKLNKEEKKKAYSDIQCTNKIDKAEEESYFESRTHQVGKVAELD
jgi:hypothetical protein